MIIFVYFDLLLRFLINLGPWSSILFVLNKIMSIRHYYLLICMFINIMLLIYLSGNTFYIAIYIFFIVLDALFIKYMWCYTNMRNENPYLFWSLNVICIIFMLYMIHEVFLLACMGGNTGGSPNSGFNPGSGPNNNPGGPNNNPRPDFSSDTRPQRIETNKRKILEHYGCSEAEYDYDKTWVSNVRVVYNRHRKLIKLQEYHDNLAAKGTLSDYEERMLRASRKELDDLLNKWILADKEKFPNIDKFF